MFCVPPMFFPVMPHDLQHRYFFLCSQVRVRPLMVSFSVSCMVSCMVVSCVVSCAFSCAVCGTVSCAIFGAVSGADSCADSCTGSGTGSSRLRGVHLVGPLEVLLRFMFCVPPMFFPVMPLDLQHHCFFLCSQVC